MSDVASWQERDANQEDEDDVDENVIFLSRAGSDRLSNTEIRRMQSYSS
jgi:hypothetical protein